MDQLFERRRLENRKSPMFNNEEFAVYRIVVQNKSSVNEAFNPSTKVCGLEHQSVQPSYQLQPGISNTIAGEISAILMLGTWRL